jgi:hypothetical protein
MMLGFRRYVEISCLLGLLRGVVWYLFTDVSGQHMGPIFKGQEPGLLTLEDGIDTLSRNVGKQLPNDST